jgi:hypothetical protein
MDGREEGDQCTPPSCSILAWTIQIPGHYPANNAIASTWWEEMIVYHCKPPVLDLFVEESRFDSKGFKMITYIDVHFNPSEAVDSLGYIFDMINIKQAPEELVVTLKACFSCVFASLKMGAASPLTRLSRLVLCSAPSVQLIKPLFRNSVLGVTPYLLQAFKRLLSSASRTTRILRSVLQEP